MTTTVNIHHATRIFASTDSYGPNGTHWLDLEFRDDQGFRHALVVMFGDDRARLARIAQAINQVEFELGPTKVDEILPLSEMTLDQLVLRANTEGTGPAFEAAVAEIESRPHPEGWQISDHVIFPREDDLDDETLAKVRAHP